MSDTMIEAAAHTPPRGRDLALASLLSTGCPPLNVIAAVRLADRGADADKIMEVLGTPEAARKVAS